MIFDDWEPIWLPILRRDNARCVYCGLDGSKDVHRFRQLMTYDHLVPLSKGGQHTVDNLVVCCWPCNRTKGRFDPRDEQDNILDSESRRLRMIERVQQHLQRDWDYFQAALNELNLPQSK